MQQQQAAEGEPGATSSRQPHSKQQAATPRRPRDTTRLLDAAHAVGHHQRQQRFDHLLPADHQVPVDLKLILQSRVGGRAGQGMREAAWRCRASPPRGGVRRQQRAPAPHLERKPWPGAIRAGVLCLQVLLSLPGQAPVRDSKELFELAWPAAAAAAAAARHSAGESTAGCTQRIAKRSGLHQRRAVASSRENASRKRRHATACLLWSLPRLQRLQFCP